MKKTLITLAIAAGSIAAAQADTTKLYGSIGYSIGLSGTGSAVSTVEDNVWDLETATAKFGIEVEENLNNGMAAFGKVEFGIDDDAGVNETKKAYLGLRGNFGQVTLGKQNTLWDAVSSKSDLFNQVAFANEGVGTASKAINYITPEMRGVTAGASIVLDGDNTGSKGVDAWEVGAWFDYNGINFGAAYQDLKHMSGPVSKVAGLSAEYEGNQYKVTADYEWNEMRGSGDSDHKAAVGAEYYYGGSAGLSKDDKSSMSTFRGNVQYDNEVTDIGLGYQYNFSNRTYTWVEGQYTIDSTDSEAKDGNYKVYTGIRHDF